jgi:heptosyltransferase I
LGTQSNLKPPSGRSLRVLIVRIGAMGDVLHALPAVAALRELHPDWFIGWAIEPVWGELLGAATGYDLSRPRTGGDSTMPLVSVWSLVPTRDWKRRPLAPATLLDISALRREMRADRYDICVDMQGAIRSSIIGRMAGAPVFAGAAKPREAPATWLYSQQVELTATHVVEQGCELLGAAIGETLRPAKVTLPIEPSAEKWCDQLLASFAGERFVIMAPTAGWGAKQWPADRYGAVAAELGRAGYRTLVNAASPGDETGNRVVAASGGAAILAPSSIGQLIALTRRASLVIAGDTGPLHLAAVLERPVVGLYGPTDPERNGPYGTRSRVLRHSSSRRDHARHRQTEAGLLQITSDEVVQAALELLQAEQHKANA